MKWTLLLLLTVLGGPLVAQDLPAVEKAKRIVFLGDSITYSGHYVTCFEAWLTLAHPDSERRVINLGLPSETVSGLSEKGHAGGSFPRPDLHERLGRVLEAVRPDYVFACYGINCGIYQPASPERLAAFQSGMTKLHEAVTKRGAVIVHVTPWPYDHQTGRIPVKSYNEEVLGSFSQWLLGKREDGWHVIDLHGPMTEEIVKRRAEDSTFTFAGDGVHAGKEGHWFATRILLRAFGAEQAADEESAAAMMKGVPNGNDILGLLEERMPLLRDAWLTRTGHKRPGIKKGLPLAAAEKRSREMQDQIDRLQKAPSNR